MAGFNEASAVQTPLLNLLKELGWRHVPGTQLGREFEDPILIGELKRALARLNPAIAEDPGRTSEIITLVRSIVLSAREDGRVQANQRLLEWLRGLRTHRFTGREGYDPVRLIDFDTPAANSIIVSDEVTFGTPGHRCRFDLVLWVNGLPLVVIETKTSTTVKSAWLKGATEIHDVYETEWPEFFVPNIFSVATDGKELHYGAVRQPADLWGVWGSTTDPVKAIGWSRVEQAARLLLSPTTVLRVVADFAAFELKRRHSEAPTLHKILPRYPQMEAVDSIIARAVDGHRRQGLIVQTQGSGKTIAMMYAAIKLVQDRRLRNPTVVVVADRIQLVGQMYAQFRRSDMPELIAPETSADLRAALAKDQRGIIFTTVHKFDKAGLLNDRSNIIVMVDEAHRTQEGQLGRHMRAALPNASFFGFTGTPIADAEKNTFRLFGDPEDPGHAMNTYDSDRSIADGNTVPMRVAPRLVDFHIDRESLDRSFEELAAEEGLSEDEADQIAQKATTARTFFSNPERVQAVASDIVGHYFSTIAPSGMKAQAVVFDRQLCIDYFDAITALLAKRGDGEAAVVMSVNSKDDPSWQRFRLDAQQEEALLDRFRDVHDPLRFLIVTSKLGTGFDAPVEGVMYLDKPMKLHTLYQAITRTNRVWKNPDTGQEKAYGLIVDYVGLGDGFARAMAPNNPEAARKEIETDALLDQFDAELANTLDRFAGIDRTSTGFEALQAAQQRIPDEKALERFNAQFGMLQGIWEALYPDLRLEDHRADYRWLATVHASVQPSDSSLDLLWARLGAKTLELVHGHIGDVTVLPAGADVVIADEETIKRLIDAGVLDEDDETGPGRIVTPVEVVDTIAARLKRRLEGPNGSHAQYRSLAERLERLRERQLAQAKDSVEWLQELLAVAKDLKAAEKAEDEAGAAGLDLLPDPKVGALSQIFEEYRPKDVPVIVERVVKDIDMIVRQVVFDGWARTSKGDRAVRKELRLTLKRYGLPLEGPLFDHAYAYVAGNY